MLADLKVLCLVAGMAAGADSVDDMDVLRHGAMSALFSGVRALFTLGSHLRSYRKPDKPQSRRAAIRPRPNPGRKDLTPPSTTPDIGRWIEA